MPQICSVCNHPQRVQIEQCFVAGATLRTIADRYGPSKTALLRHRNHVAGTIALLKADQDTARSATLLDDVRVGEGRAERLYQQAEEILAGALREKDRRSALQAIRAAVDVMGQARGYLEHRGELNGELGRDRAQPAMAIQIICPVNPGGWDRSEGELQRGRNRGRGDRPDPALVNDDRAPVR